MDCIVHGTLQDRLLEVGSPSLLQGIFPTQGWNLGLLHCRPILYQTSDHRGRCFMAKWHWWGQGWPAKASSMSWGVGSCCLITDKPLVKISPESNDWAVLFFTEKSKTKLICPPGDNL